MKRIGAFLTALVLVAAMAFSLAGCGLTDKMDEVVDNSIEKVESQTGSKYDSYESIYNEYSKKILKQGKTYAKDMKNDAAARFAKDGTLAKLLKEQTDGLNSLYNEGVSAMSEYMLFSGDTQEGFTEWKNKLYDSYREAEDGVMDAYTEALRTVK